jgi:hypothetical protein
MKPVSPAAPTKSMAKVGVWCLVVLFALSIATAVCLDDGNTVPVDDFAFAAFTTDGSLTDGEGRIGSVSRIPAWVSAVHSDLAGVDPDSLRPSHQRSYVIAVPTPDAEVRDTTCASTPDESIAPLPADHCKDISHVSSDSPSHAMTHSTVPDVLGFHPKLELHDRRADRRPTVSDGVGKTKVREVIDGSWDERLAAHHQQFLGNCENLLLGFSLRTCCIGILIVFAAFLVHDSRLVSNNNVASRAIDSYFVPTSTSAWFAAFPCEYIVPVATIVPSCCSPASSAPCSKAPSPFTSSTT